MSTSTERHRANWQTAAVMGVSGVLFVVLAVATVSPLWVAAAAIDFIGAADAILRPFYLSEAAA